MRAFICLFIVLANIALIGNIVSTYMIILMFIQLIVFSVLSVLEEIKEEIKH